jgi:hypothetical protein
MFLGSGIEGGGITIELTSAESQKEVLGSDLGYS